MFKKLKYFSEDLKWAVEVFCGNDDFKRKQMNRIVRKSKELYDRGYDKWENGNSVFDRTEGIGDLIAQTMVEERYYKRIRYWLWLECCLEAHNSKPPTQEEMWEALRKAKKHIKAIKHR